MNPEDVLKQCTIEGTTVKLPEFQLERNTYLDVAKRLQLIGGKWNRKAQGFVFQEDPTTLLAQVNSGEQRNIKKEFQFFETPAPLADWLVELADIQAEHSVLEPSAGQGAIVKAIGRVFPEKKIDCFELMGINCYQLQKLPTVNLIGNDFLKADSSKQYDRIVANPPFAKHADIAHIRKMYELLNDAGRIVTIASCHSFHASHKVDVAFREWMDEIGATVEDVPAGSFKESGTLVPAKMIVIDK